MIPDTSNTTPIPVVTTPEISQFSLASDPTRSSCRKAPTGRQSPSPRRLSCRASASATRSTLARGQTPRAQISVPPTRSCCGCHHHRVTLCELLQRPLAVRPGRPLALVAVVLLLAAGIGYFFAADYVWADRLFGHYVALGGGAWLLGGLSVVRAARPHTRIAIALTMLFVTSSALLLIGGASFAVLDSGREVVGVAPSPDGRATAVITAEPWAIDTVYRVTIRENRGLLARQWYAGCLNGDDPADAYDSMRWTGPTTLALRTGDGRELQLRTDRGTSRPQNLLSGGATDLCA